VLSIQIMPSAAVAYHPAVPRHLQIQRVLRASIHAGEWEPDRPMPTEMALVQRFGVSRTTIREALGVLAREGLIVRHRGRGSFVRPASARPAPPEAVTNLVLGYRAEITVIAAETVPAPAGVARLLGVERGSPLARLVRLETVARAPLAVAVNYMPPALGARIRPRDLARTSLLELLRDRLRLRLGTIRQSIEARLPDVEVAGLLGIDLTAPVLAVRLVVHDVAGQPVEVADTSYRADRYRYETETRLPPARPPAARHARPRPRARAPRQP
jgi:GntR family transcriptional regulator